MQLSRQCSSAAMTADPVQTDDPLWMPRSVLVKEPVPKTCCVTTIWSLRGVPKSWPSGKRQVHHGFAHGSQQKAEKHGSQRTSSAGTAASSSETSAFVSVLLMAYAATFCSRYLTRFVPGIGNTSSPCDAAIVVTEWV